MPLSAFQNIQVLLCFLKISVTWRNFEAVALNRGVSALWNPTLTSGSGQRERTVNTPSHSLWVRCQRIREIEQRVLGQVPVVLVRWLREVLKAVWLAFWKLPTCWSSSLDLTVLLSFKAGAKPPNKWVLVLVLRLLFLTADLGYLQPDAPVGRPKAASYQRQIQMWPLKHVSCTKTSAPACFLTL